MSFDVAIIGGGPAGCSAALACRARGLSAVVISTPAPYEKPTETAVPTLRQILDRIGVPQALRACEPCYGISSDWGRPEAILLPAILNPLGHAWFIHRARFDAELQQATRNAGAVWITAKAQGVKFDDNGVSIAMAEQPIGARWVVFATGSPAWPARMTGQRSLPMDSLINFWARFPVPLDERLLHVEAAAGGWWYFCPGDDGNSIASFVTDSISARTLNAASPARWNELFRMTTLARRLAVGASASRVHAGFTNFAVLPQKHGPQWIAIGDAAAKLDPLGSSGTATALDSGRRAAEAIAAILDGHPEHLAVYDHWNHSLVEEFARQRRRQYETEARHHPENIGFWSRRMSPGQITQFAA
jgi:flavin-dependent dehydrogenase